MKAPWSGQLSAAKTGWLVALLFFGWLAYLLLPAPKRELKPAVPLLKSPPSRLVAMGLPDNIDFEHLPEFFALYADQAEWEKDKTLFAYWNPGSNGYAYFFEATRVNGSYHFKEMPEIEASDDEVIFDSGLRWGDNLPKDCPIRFIYADRGHSHDVYGDLLRVLRRNRSTKSDFTPRVELKMNQDQIKLPWPESTLPFLDLEQNKKSTEKISP